MREIKFRAMTDYSRFSVKLESEMVYGTGIFTDGVNTWLASHDGIRCLADNIAFKVVSKESIGQYTGLKDKNGKEIYEGDIVQDKVNNCVWRYVIQSISFMGNNLFAICIWRNFTVIDDETIMGDYPVKDGNWNYISSRNEVIGNIYENPELLK